MFGTSPVHTVCGSQQHQILFVDGIACSSLKLLWMSDLLATTGLVSTCPQIFTDNIAMKIHEGGLCHRKVCDVCFVMFALLQSFPHFVILPYSAHLIYNLLSSFKKLEENARVGLLWRGCQSHIDVQSSNVQMCSIPAVFRNCTIQVWNLIIH